MQACSCFLCKSYGQLGALVTSLCIAYLRMMNNVRVVTIHRFELSHALVDTIGFLAMCHNQGRAITEDVPECLFFIDQHIACAAAHEELHARNAIRINVKDFLKIVVCGTQEESIVYVALLCCYLVTFFQKSQGGCLGWYVGHIQHGGDTSCSCCTCLCFHVGLVRKTWVTHVYVIVYNAREENGFLLPIFFAESFLWSCYLRDYPILYNYGAKEYFSFVNNYNILNLNIHLSLSSDLTHS